ncbi:hypothetical protein HNR42_003035 [Deinobacterium chartae]|uniref:Uncharacterized protein n=1 Tax=Deinobacterium chartae TaxID=521158 RepID=A0A841I6R0_9DEIO|nr:hypothetical protein [Deinobacterium chartae]MBB6099582.1 hypothetical protein [Deinobacterium chartae]
MNCRDCAYSVILEPSFAEKVRSRATGVVAYGYDPQTRRVAPPGQA